MNISITEEININSVGIDQKSTLEILTIMNNENKQIPLAIEKILPDIANLVDAIVPLFKKGGRIIYVGAGTSGRLGVLDASECPPTFNTEPWQVLGIIAGGDYALRNAVEGAEDNKEQGAKDLKSVDVNNKDVVIGIAASGNTPYVYGALEYAKNQSITTAAISSNKHASILEIVDHKLHTDSGPEIISGSTRLKAGTSQKLVLNMITTSAMIKIGKVYGNLMVDLKPTNNKLVARSKKIIDKVLDCGEAASEKLFLESGKSVKIAIIMGSLGLSKEQCIALLKKNNDSLNKVLINSKSE